MLIKEEEKKKKLQQLKNLVNYQDYLCFQSLCPVSQAQLPRLLPSLVLLSLVPPLRRYYLSIPSAWGRSRNKP